MKRIFTCLIMAMVSMGATAEPDTKEYKTYVKDDHHVFYCTHEGITVVVDPTKDGIFEPHIIIINESGRDFVFEPQKITASAFAIPGVTMKSSRYRVERFLEKGDTLGFEKDQLTLYTPEKYRKKVNNSYWWGSMLGAAIAGAVVAGVDAATNNQNRSSDDRAADRLIEDKYIDRAMQENSEVHARELKRISEDYWRANTIFDCSEHEGFIAIKPVKSKYIILDIPVDGENYHFLIDNQKRY